MYVQQAGAALRLLYFGQGRGVGDCAASPTCREKGDPPQSSSSFTEMHPRLELRQRKKQLEVQLALKHLFQKF